jgi:hypothetical protein
MKSAIWKSGYNSYVSGLGRMFNPWRIDDLAQWKQWDAGWVAGKQEFEPDEVWS